MAHFGDWIYLTEKISVPPMLYALLVFIASWAIALVLRKILWRSLIKWTATTKVDWDDALVQCLNVPSRLLTLVIALAAAEPFFPPLLRTELKIDTSLKTLFIIAGMITADYLIRFLFSQDRFLKDLSKQGRSALAVACRTLSILTGALIIIDTFGISITPILASLGVGSLAVALALQDTLSNFFSGIYILVDRPVRMGDYIQIEQGLAGTIEKIGWRNTRIRLMNNNLLVIPNSKLATAQVTNFDMPSREMSLTIECSVAYGTDLDVVETLAIEVGTAVSRDTNGGVEGITPLVRFHTFGDSGILFTVILRAKHVTDGGLLKHAFIKALYKRFAEMKIEIPFPQRVVRQVTD